MKIICPHCGLSGRISEQKLKASSGSVRCPGCRKTFAPVVTPQPGADIPTKTPTPSAKGRHKKEEETLVGARSDDDVPFTRVMENVPTASDEGLVVEIEGIDFPEMTQERPDEAEILPLSDQDILADTDAETLPIGEVSIGAGEGPDVFGKRPSRGLFGLFSRKAKEPPADKPTAPPVPRKTAAKAIRRGFIAVLLFVLALWGGYWFFSTYWPPYVKEKEFIADSRVLFDKYHELMVYLRVGLPDPVFATKVAEAAYVWEVYREKHQKLYGNDPLFVSLTATGRLFLAVKELLDRDMSPDNFLGLEWGEGLPFLTKEEYVNALVAGIPLCITAAEKNFQFTKELLDRESDRGFISAMINDVTGGRQGSERLTYVPELKKANKDFMAVESSMPVLKEAVLDITQLINTVGKK
jgi:predicted Zn finger-like uncharacterized protein